MSRSPNVVVAAAIYVPKGVELISFLSSIGVTSDREIELDSNLYYVHLEVDEQCIVEKENAFIVQNHITYGWGSTCSLFELKTKIETFEENIKSFCNQHNLTYTIHIGANYW